MNLAIIGYGKMGKMIEQLATKKGHTTGLIIDINNTQDLNAENLKNIDCAIEFTTPQTAVQNFMVCFEHHVPVVSGTTGWLDQMETIKNECNKNNGAFFYASNFSLGVNILFKVNQYLANIMKNFEAYDITIDETHHIHKLDKPSGTAITLAKQIIEKIPKKQQWSLNRDSDNDLQITSHREGEVVGIHKVTYTSPIDSITIAHEAFSREGFANGAIMAAEFLKDKHGCFGMNDLLKSFNIN